MSETFMRAPFMSAPVGTGPRAGSDGQAAHAGAHRDELLAEIYAATGLPVRVLRPDIAALIACERTPVKPGAGSVGRGPKGGVWTPERRAAAAERMRRLNADPEFAAARDAAVGGPEARVRHGARMRALFARPEMKARHGARMRAVFARPEVKARHAEAMALAYADPQRKAGRSAALRAAMARAEVKERHAAAVRATRARALVAQHCAMIEAGLVPQPPRLRPAGRALLAAAAVPPHVPERWRLLYARLMHAVPPDEAETHLRRLLRAAAPGVAVPGWVPAALVCTYLDRAAAEGEEAAAGHVRRLKRGMARP